MIKHHVKEEEKRSEGLLAQAKAAGLDMDALAEQLTARKEELTRQFADGHLPPAHTRSYTGHNLVQDKPLGATPSGAALSRPGAWIVPVAAIEPRPSLVQAAEQLDGPLALRDVGEHVGEADALGIDDECHWAARVSPGAPRSRSATFWTCSRVNSDVAWETSMILA